MTEETLFELALNTPEADRAALLARECADRPELRARVEALLAAHFASSSSAPVTGEFALEGGTRTFGEPATASYHGTGATVDTVVAGKYTLVEQIGEGGMGSVWRAKQTEPVKRFVALKLIKAGMDSRQVMARFEAERQALAVMDHPNIAKVLDGGLHEGRPFFVMELVKGVPITEYCDTNKLTPKARLELFVQACQAIQHAHQKGVIHRDVKPSNVLVALYDDRPVVKVIDFGVAKATGGALTEATLDTGFGAVIGTPQYMSPEQATFNNLDIDTRSDVYALGVLLYELLTGSPPFSKKELEKKGLMEILRAVREDEPPRPSTKLSTAEALPSLSANRGTEPKKLTGLLRNELDWIVMKALEKDRARRYETANGFAADCLRYLAGEPVSAHPPSTAYRLKKFVRRNRGQVLAGSLVLCSMIAGIAGTTLGMLRAQAARESEEQQRKRAEDSRDEAVAERKRADEEAEVAKAVSQFISHDLLSKGNPYIQATGGHTYEKDITLRAVVDRAAARIDERFKDRPLVAAALHHAVANVYQGQLEPAKAIPHDERCWELTRAVRGDDHRETISAVNSIGANLLNNGEAARAQMRFRDGYDRAKRLFGEEDTLTMLLLNNLAVACQLNGQQRESAELRRRYNDLTLRVYGESDVRSVHALLAKASRLTSARQLDEADETVRRAYELVRDKLPEHDQTRVTVTERWIGVLIRRGSRAEAEALAQAAHASCMKQFKTLGTGSTPWSGKCLARTYHQLGKLDAAERLGRELLAVERTHCNGNPGDRDLCEARQFLIRVYESLGKPELAEPLLVEQVAHDKERGSAARTQLANNYALRGKFPEAETLLQQHVDWAKATHGAGSMPHGSSLLSLGSFLSRREKWSDAERYIREGLAIMEKGQPKSIAVRTTKGALGRALLGRKKYAEAEPLLLEALNAYKELVPKQNVTTASPQAALIDSLIELYTATNKPDEVAKWRAERAKYPNFAPMPREKK